MSAPAPTPGGAVRSHVTSHVLDTVTGAPAVGLRVVLERLAPAPRDAGTTPGADASRAAPGEAWERVGAQATDADGRCTALGPQRLEAGTYRLVLATGEWFAAAGRQTFYPRVVVEVTLADPGRHHHVPVLLGPFAYTTYRGT